MSALTTVSTNHLATVQSIYEAFGKGDIATILNNLTDEVTWEHAGNPQVLPFAGKVQGKDAVLRFFQTVGKEVQFLAFEPSNFREVNNMVITDVFVKGIINKTGKQYITQNVFTWTFNEDGKITAYNNEADMSELEAAYL